VKNARQISELFKKRRSDQGGRINAYRKFLNAYRGSNADSALGEIQANYQDGRPAMRYLAQAHNDMLTRRGAPNFAYPVIRDLSAIYGALPDARVKPETGDKNDVDTAVKRTRILLEQYNHSKMGTKASRIGFFAACLGDNVCTLDPKLPGEDDDPENPPGIYINVVSAVKCYPSFVGGEDSRELDDLVICDLMTAEDIQKRYDYTASDDEREIFDVYTYYSRDQKAVVIDNGIREGVQHNLGFVPAQWFSKEITDGKLAQGDLAQAVDLAFELQALYYTFVDSVVASTYPILVVKGGQAAIAQDAVEQGPGARVDVSIAGDVKYVQPEGNPQAAQIVFQAALDNFMKVVGVSPIRTEGDVQHANTSSKALQAAQAPMQSRVNQAYILLGECYESMNSKILRMLSKIPEFSRGKPMSLYGADSKGTYNETYTGKDVAGWTRNEVSWDNFLGESKTERLHNALLLYKSNPQGFPWAKVLEEYGLEDPEELIAEGQATAALQGQPQPGQPAPQAPGQAPPGAPGPSGGPTPTPGPGGTPPPGAVPPGLDLGQGQSPAQPDLSAGAAPTGPTQPQMPDFPQSSAAPNAAPQPAPLPDLAGDIQQAMAGVQLFGQVTDGPRPYPGGIFVEVSNSKNVSNDIAAIKAALTPVAHQDIGPSATVRVTIQKSKAAKGKK
jgi:hypothetical protein